MSDVFARMARTHGMTAKEVGLQLALIGSKLPSIGPYPWAGSDQMTAIALQEGASYGAVPMGENCPLKASLIMINNWEQRTGTSLLRWGWRGPIQITNLAQIVQAAARITGSVGSWEGVPYLN